MGGMEYLDAGTFERSFKNFETIYKNTSRKTGTAMLETLKQECRNYVDNPQWSHTSWKRFRIANCIKALHENRAVLIGSRKPVKISRLQNTQKYARENGRFGFGDQTTPGYVWHLYQVVRGNWMTTLIKLSYLQFIGNKYPIYFLSLYHIPCNLSCLSSMYNIIVYLWRTSRHKLQQVFASSSFFDRERKRFDFVKIENSDDCFLFLDTTLFPVWSAKVPCFIIVSETKLKCKMDADVSSKMCETT